MIFIDSNIPMYLVGADHPHKLDSKIVIEKMLSESQRLVTSVEVFQEILHRYAALNRKDMIQHGFDALKGIVTEIFPVTEPDIEKAKELVLAYPLTARDALHAALMANHQIKKIISFDKGFDQLPFIQRIS